MKKQIDNLDLLKYVDKPFVIIGDKHKYGIGTDIEKIERFSESEIISNKKFLNRINGIHTKNTSLL